MASSTNPLSPIFGDQPPPPLLTHSQEIELSQQITAGRIAAGRNAPTPPAKRRAAKRLIAQGQAAREALVLHNLPLVVSIAARFRHSELSYDDLIQEGILGLLKAADKYDPQRGTRFGTLAVWWIRQSIGRAVANTGRGVRLPVNRAWRIGQLRRAAARLAQETGETPNLEDIARAAGLSVAMAESLLRDGQPLVSLDAPPAPDDRALLERLADANTQDPETIVMERDLTQAIEKSLSRLDAKEAKILRQRFGLGGGEARPLRSIAAEWHMSPEGVRQISERAMTRLREMPDVRALCVYLED
jgi:RNA polymerase primary sigma factor